MKRAVLCLVGVAALTLTIGCDPFETELTLNADGSGRMVQKAELSPAAYVMLKQNTGMRLRGYRPVLTDAAAKSWSEYASQAGVQVLAYSSTLEVDGALRVQCEVSFRDLKALSDSPWGWPLQVGVTEAVEGMQVQMDDPARFVALVFMTSQAPTVSPPPKVTEPGGLEYMAGREVFSALVSGFKSRLNVNLPVPAVSADGGVLSADRKVLTVERMVGQGRAGFVDWLQKKPATFVLPADLVKLKPFAAAPALAGERSVMISKPVEVGKDEGYQFRLQSISINATRTMSYENPAVDPVARSNQSLSVQMNLLCPPDARLINTQGWEQDRQPVHMLSTARDSEGTDLRMTESSLYFNPYYSGRSGRGMPRGQAAGNVSINLRSPSPNAKTLTLEGYISAMQLAEEERVEIKPLKENLNKDFEMPTMTLRILSIKGSQVDFSVVRKDRSGYQDPSQDMQWLSGDGRELLRSGMNSRGGGDNKIVYQQTFNSAFPDDGHLVITYPSKVREIRIPFSFKDVKLP